MGKRTRPGLQPGRWPPTTPSSLRAPRGAWTEWRRRPEDSMAPQGQRLRPGVCPEAEVRLGRDGLSAQSLWITASPRLPHCVLPNSATETAPAATASLQSSPQTWGGNSPASLQTHPEPRRTETPVHPPRGWHDSSTRTEDKTTAPRTQMRNTSSLAQKCSQDNAT